MVHPATGKTISSYKKLVHDLATAEVWQMAFGKDYEGMAQEDIKTGQKGTKTMFVMTHNKIAHAFAVKKNNTRKPCCQLKTTERVPPWDPNNSKG